MKIQVYIDSYTALSSIIDLIHDIRIKDVEVCVSRLVDNLGEKVLYYTPEIHRDIRIVDGIALGENVILGSLSCEEKPLYFSRIGVGWDSYLSLIHPTATISSSAIIGKGVIIQPGVVIGAYTRIGNCVCVGANTTIGSHCIVNDFSVIESGVHIGNECLIDEKSHIFMGVNVINKVSIGKYTIINTGSMVNRDISGWKYVSGVPPNRVMRDYP